jgi:demethylmenaquinone methyltransferase/2-methoxy-6-polyprenyl-1,4-benzoquinol methylase
MTSSGTTPRGVSGEEAASRWVRGMFGSIASRYDLLNHVLSFNLDRGWRARLVDRVAHVVERPGARVLDLCCGTGDVLLSIEARRGAAVFGSDFCHPMLIEAQRKISARGMRSRLFEADALALPIAGGSLDLITVAFGFRNLANYRSGFTELARVLKPGGVLAILEFSQPSNRAFAALYGFFSKQVLPRVGRMVSGSRDAYSYLPESIQKFPGPDDLAQEMREAGFSSVEFEPLTFGAVALHLGRK